MTAFVVGLTGGIGSGKSAAADRFAQLGAAVVDTDAIAHELTDANGAAMPAIRAEFGEGLVAADGSLDRAAMRWLVFSDAFARRRLEGVLHPMIRAEGLHRCAEATAPYAVLVVPLLLEAGKGYRTVLNRIVVIDCTEETQIARVMARSGFSREETLKILAAQTSRAARRAAADDVVVNDGDLASLHRQVEDLHHRYLKLAEMSSGS